MTDDFVTQLRLQLREAALREERRGPVAQRVVRARRSLPGAAPAAVALAVALLALAVALGAVVLRGQPEPAARPEVIGTYRVASGLSPLAPGFGAVWTADPIRGQVLRIDVATRRVVARIPVHGDALVSTGAGAVWALAGDLQFAGSKGPVRLLRIDPATNRVVARIALRPPRADASRRSTCRSTVGPSGSSGRARARCASIPGATSPTCSCRWPTQPASRAAS